MFVRCAVFAAALATGAEAFAPSSGAVSLFGAAAPAVSSLSTRGSARFAPKMAAGMDDVSTAEYTEQLKGAKAELEALIDKTNSNPIMVRLGWHDSGTHDASITEAWPKSGGAIGSIRFDPEINHGANAGLASAVKMLEPVKAKFPKVTYADLFQMASATGIELAGGPKLGVRYGRVDATSAEQCSPEGNLPDAEAGPEGKYGGAGGTKSTEDTSPNGHLRKVFGRMGLNDEEIVALSGAHTLGRAWKTRSGLGADKTKFTDGSKVARGDGKEGIGAKGGSSWTEKWLKFDNSYFTTMKDESADPELLKLSTDKTLFADDGFKPFAEKFASDEKAFFESYAKAHKKLSELGSKFDPAEGITL